MVWWFIAGAFSLLAIHPLTTYPFSLFIVSKLLPASRVAMDSISATRVAILFCAYNEEAVIREKLLNCIALCVSDPNAHVYVYTDGCTDRTMEIVQEFDQQVYVIEGKSRRGKSVGMNELSRAAKQDDAEILFFTDANVLLDSNAISAMRREFSDRAVGCVTGHLAYINPKESVTASVGTRYWSVDSMIKQLETKSGSCIGADGSIFGIRAELYRLVPENIIDDFFTSMSVLCDGWRCIYSRDVIAHERAATASGEEYRRKVRIACRAFNCHRLLWPRLKRLSALNFYKYVSHKLIRWLMIFWIMGAMVGCVGGIVTLSISRLAVVAILVAGVVLSCAVWALPGPPWRHLKEAAIAIMATGVGVLKSVRGERFQTWSQAPSTRQAVAKPKAEV